MRILPDDTDPAEIRAELWGGFRQTALGYDVGANCGQSVGTILRFSERVVSFEPDEESFKILAGRWADDIHVDVENIAVSQQDGIVELARLPGKQAETGQLVTPSTRGMEWDPGDWHSAELVPCHARSLDSIAGSIGPPGFIKVDTEGHELAVLLGAAGLLYLGEAEWLIEFHTPENHDECETLLEKAGYDPVTIRHPHYPYGSHMWKQHGWLKAFAPRREES